MGLTITNRVCSGMVRPRLSPRRVQPHVGMTLHEFVLHCKHDMAEHEHDELVWFAINAPQSAVCIFRQHGLS